MICFKDFSLVNGVDQKALENAWMLVDQGKIVDVGSGNAPEAAKTVSLEGKYVMPGMIDCHTHITSYVVPGLNCLVSDDTEKLMLVCKNFQYWLEDGVTFVRDVGSFAHNKPEKTIQKLVKMGVIDGPNFYTALQFITMTGGHGHRFGARVADGVEEVKKATREMIRDGADFIKTITTGGAGTEGNDVNAYQYNQDELEAIVTEAHKAGKKVAAHSHGAEGIKNGVRAGIDTIEHGTMIDDEAIALMVEHGTWLVPTFAICEQTLDPNNTSAPQYMVEAERKLAPYHKVGFRKAYEAGVRFAAGTDLPATSMRHAVAKELSYMKEAAGMSNLEALQAGTKNAAELIGIDQEYGTLETGKYADFVVLNENPLDDLTTTERPVYVYQHGIKKK